MNALVLLWENMATDTYKMHPKHKLFEDKKIELSIVLCQ